MAPTLALSVAQLDLLLPLIAQVDPELAAFIRRFETSHLCT